MSKAELGRDTKTGRYTNTKMDALCVCGHSLGEHTAACSGGERPCVAGDFDASIDCGCMRYRKATKANR